MSSAGGRFFSSSRDLRKKSAASEMMRIEIEKKGKFSAKERYQRIFKEKLKQSQENAMNGGKTGGFKLPGSAGGPKKMSKTAEKAMKEISQKKAREEAKAMRRMVFVQPKTFANGRVTAKGKILDVADNQIGTINRKDGKMTTTMGWSLGKYKPRNMMTNMAIQEAINKYSPYYIQQRRLAALAGADNTSVWGNNSGQEVINIYGRMAQNTSNAWGATTNSTPTSSFWGGGGESARTNVGVTAWGVQSDNVFGTFSDNVFGTMADNVWGGTDNNVWGGIGVTGGMWGQKSQHVWGTGNGKNFLKFITSRVAAFFGLGGKTGNAAKLAAFRAARTGGRTGGSGRTSAPSGRTSAPSGRK